MKRNIFLAMACGITLFSSLAQDFTAPDILTRRDAFARLRKGEGVESALKALPSLNEPDKAAVVSALIASADKPGVRAVLTAALDDEAPLVRLAGIQAAIALADGNATEKLFALAAQKDEIGKTAAFALQALKSDSAATWLRNAALDKNRPQAERDRAFTIIAARGEKDLVPLLLAPDSANAASAHLLRSILEEADFGQALQMVMRLPADKRDPFLSALGGAYNRFSGKGKDDSLKAIEKEIERSATDAERVQLIPLLASAESAEASAFLSKQLQSPSVDIRKETVRTLAKWNGEAAMGSLEKATHDNDQTVRILAERACAERSVGTRIIAINAGGPAVGGFSADQKASGGKPYSTTHGISTAAAGIGAAPEDVYKTSRYGNMVYTIDGLTPSKRYRIRLHFAEPFFSTPARSANVLVNGKAALEDFDIVKATGGEFTAIVKSIMAEADGMGKLTIDFRSVKDNALVCGLEVFEVPVTAVQATAKTRVLLLTGANNHNWKKTTAALVSVLSSCPSVSVTVDQEAWNLKPEALRSCDVLFFNWNTFGPDKREWSQEMKDAFIPWVKNGGGVVILHAGGSLFYNWKEFQSLIGGTWKDGTFHPRYQACAVHIADAAHPVTKGITDFETVDEPWQKLTNGNPNRKVLATVTTSKANGGTGEPEVAALVTELGKGRCFNLVLGHDAAAIKNPGFVHLLCNGIQWAGSSSTR
jgi:type 1 glutamine amidotransferase